MNKSLGFNEKVHEIKFKSLFENKNLSEAFRKVKTTLTQHLETELNTESFDFYFEVQSLKEKKELETKKEYFKKIFERFFLPKDKSEIHKYELNVSSEIKKKMIKFYKTLDSVEDMKKHENFLEKVNKIVLQELEADVVNL
jgi:hypothetical protein